MEEKYIYYLTANLTSEQFNIVIKKHLLIKEGDKTVFFKVTNTEDKRMFKSELMVVNSYGRTISLNNLQYSLYCTEEQLKEGKAMVISAITKRVSEIESELKKATKLINKKIEERIC